MSTRSSLDEPEPLLLRPQPRRPGPPPLLTPRDSVWALPSASPPADPSLPKTDFDKMASSRQRPSFLNLSMTTPQDETPESPVSASETPQRSRSLLNLTASTLFGIYAPSVSSPDRHQSPNSMLMDSNDPQRTPWGTGAQTPLEWSRPAAFPGPYTRSAGGVSSAAVAAKLQQKRRPTVSSIELAVAAVLRVALLAGVGVAYGAFITHLHDHQGIAPVRVGIERRNLSYLGFWGGLAVLLGAALPYVDGLLKSAAPQPRRAPRSTKTLERLGGEWMPLVRSVGAFVGIAFAIRKLPWQSTQQLSLTLALVNPCLWYLVDRTRSGLFLSTITAILGASVLITLVPEIIPQPHVASSSSLRDVNWWKGAFGGPGEALKAGDNLQVSGALHGVGIATWTGSVLFCSSVFFGNVGRKVWGDLLS